jgi:predicted dehydrogenase
MTEKINWGIIGCGRISAAFARGLRLLRDTRLTAVASLTPGKAETFAKRFHASKAYTDYESLAADKDVDIVYIGTLHNAHMPNTLLALDNGKHVLCEKPFALNAKEAAAMIQKAQEKELFLMEAMWTRFLPASRKIRQLLDRGLSSDSPPNGIPRTASTTLNWPEDPSWIWASIPSPTPAGYSDRNHPPCTAPPV